ncbi:MAG TPA: hypothetical protein VGI79_01155 [Caulobacteraceae bacterium]
MLRSGDGDVSHAPAFLKARPEPKAAEPKAAEHKAAEPKTPEAKAPEAPAEDAEARPARTRRRRAPRSFEATEGEGSTPASGATEDA